MIITINTFTFITIIFIVSIILENLIYYWFKKNKDNLLLILITWWVKNSITVLLFKYAIINIPPL